MTAVLIVVLALSAPSDHLHYKLSEAEATALATAAGKKQSIVFVTDGPAVVSFSTQKGGIIHTITRGTVSRPAVAFLLGDWKEVHIRNAEAVTRFEIHVGDLKIKVK